IQVNLEGRETDPEQDAAVPASAFEFGQVLLRLRRHRLAPPPAQIRVSLLRINVELIFGVAQEFCAAEASRPVPGLAKEALDYSGLDLGLHGNLLSACRVWQTRGHGTRVESRQSLN